MLVEFSIIEKSRSLLEDDVIEIIDVVVTVLVTVEVLTVVVGPMPVNVVLVTVASNDEYDKALAEIITAAITTAIARRVKLRAGVAFI
jgi:uncharacterized protein YejL (UPF0352 family)